MVVDVEYEQIWPLRSRGEFNKALLSEIVPDASRERRTKSWGKLKREI